MNDGNILYYLQQEMEKLKSLIKMDEDNIEMHHRMIIDADKRLKSLRVHYTSLLNTAIAYGHEVEEDET